MLYVLLEQYGLAAIASDAAISQMVNSLEKYEKKPNHDKTRVALTKQQIEVIQNANRLAAEVIEAYDQVRAENRYLKQKINDYKQQIERPDEAMNMSKEDLRLFSINRAHELYPELY